MTSSASRLRERYRCWKYRRSKRRLHRARRERQRLEQLYPEDEPVGLGTALYEFIRLIWMQTVRWLFP